MDFILDMPHLFKKCFYFHREQVVVSYCVSTMTVQLFYRLTENNTWPSHHRPGEMMSGALSKPDIFHDHLRELAKSLDVFVIFYVHRNSMYF